MLIDIVIPTYNRSAFIEQAVISVINQSYKEWNLYILDNASEDDTRLKVQKYLSKNVFYIRNNYNLGMLLNWKKAINEIGSSKIVVLLSDDDELCSDFLEKAVLAIELCPELGLYSSSVYIKTKDKKYTWHPDGVQNENYENYKIYNPCENFNMWLRGNPVSPAAILINRSALKSIHDWNESYIYLWAFDKYWWTQIALNYKIVFYNKPTAIYNQHEQSASKTLDIFMHKKIIQESNIISQICNYVSNQKLFSLNYLEQEIKILPTEKQIYILNSLIINGTIELNHFSNEYFKKNKKTLIKSIKRSNIKFIYSVLGLKLSAHLKFLLLAIK